MFKRYLYNKFPSALNLIIFITVTALPAFAYAADWQVGLTVKTGTVYNRLVLGADATATNSYDPVWDTYALMGGSGAVEAYFAHPEWGLTHQDYHRDIKAHAPASTLEWVMTVRSSLTSAAFTITWDLGYAPGENPVTLIDNSTGQETDMRTAGSYVFTYNDVRTFTIRVSEISSCSNLPVRVSRPEPVYYSTLQEAYNAANDGETIESRAVSLTENLNININKSITFSGGYDCMYTSVSGATTLNGILTIENGGVTIENLVVQ